MIHAITLPLLCGFLCAAGSAQASLTKLTEKFSGIDLDGDGIAELGRLQLVESKGKGKPLLVLLEDRLSSSRDLRKCVSRYLEDLANDGYAASLVCVGLPSRGPHRDGRIVLALRRFLQAYDKQVREFAGVVLVGHFPDAYLVRTVNWRKETKLKLGPKSWNRVRYLRRVPEDVARRCDLVLSDLDGNWEDRYVQESKQLPTLYAVWPKGVPDKGGPCRDITEGEVKFVDFFHVIDGEADVAGKAVRINDDIRDLECTPEDRMRGNPIARPDICVSRIDARGVAWSPKRILSGRSLFDAKSQPASISLRSGEKPNCSKDLWDPDPALELRLLTEYFDRNHRYRTTRRGIAFKPASISWGLGSGFNRMKLAAKEWKGFKEDGYDVRENVDLCSVIDWFQLPAVLRTLRAHSSERGSSFKKTELPALHAAIGGPPLCWTRRGKELVPSMAQVALRGQADFFLWRTIFENDVLPDYPYLMVHTGCHAISPTSSHLPYSDREYGAFQNAASLLFLTPALTIVGRAKVFYDEPCGFVEALAEGKTIGAAWARYFDLESKAKSWKEVGGDIGRKRSYFWSVLGDWTLKLEN